MFLRGFVSRQLRKCGQSALAELLQSRNGRIVDRMIFMHCDGLHWTLHDHDLTGPQLAIRTWNSLPTHSEVDISDQAAITSASKEMLDATRRSDISLSSLPDSNIDPRLQAPDRTVQAHPTGLQVDSYSCGFWAIFFGWAMLLDFEPSIAARVKLQVTDLKGMFAAMWQAYSQWPNGLPSPLVKDLFAAFSPKVRWEVIPATVSCRTCVPRPRP